MWLSEIGNTFLFWLKKSLFFYLFICVVSDSRRIRGALWSLVLALLVLSGMGWQNYLSGVDGFGGRLSSVGNYNNPNSFGLLLTVSWPLVFCLMESEKNVLKKGVLILFLVLMFLTCIYTKSRGSLLSLSLSVTLCLLFSRQLLKSKVLKTVALAGVYLAVGGFALTMIMSRSDVTGMVGSGEASGGDRLLAWRAALAMFLDHPFFGVGWYHFVDYCLDYGLDKKLVAHNTLLSVLAETGLVGFSLFIAILAMTLRQLYRMVRFYQNRLEYQEFYLLCYGAFISLVCFQVNTLFSVKDHEPVYWFILMLAGSLWGIHSGQTKQWDANRSIEESQTSEEVVTQLRTG
jgi:O-antigen ligase